MIYVKQEVTTHRWGYEIVEGMEGSAHLGFRVLESSFEGFDGPGEVYAMVTALQKAFLERKYKVGKSPETGFYGFQVYEKDERGKLSILTENFGWLDTNEVNEHISELTNALRGETKMVQAPPLPQKSKKSLTVELPKNFIIDEDE